MKASFSPLACLALFLCSCPLFASPVCNNANKLSCSNQKMASPADEEKALMRSMRRQHTRQAYEPVDIAPYSLQNNDGQRQYRGKKMSADERMRLRQQIDEAKQDIYLP